MKVSVKDARCTNIPFSGWEKLAGKSIEIQVAEDYTDKVYIKTVIGRCLKTDALWLIYAEVGDKE